MGLRASRPCNNHIYIYGAVSEDAPGGRAAGWMGRGGWRPDQAAAPPPAWGCSRRGAKRRPCPAPARGAAWGTRRDGPPRRCARTAWARSGCCRPQTPRHMNFTPPESVTCVSTQDHREWVVHRALQSSAQGQSGGGASLWDSSPHPPTAGRYAA